MYTELVRGVDIPSSFSEATIVPIPKVGDRAVATNYRPISLLQSSYKIFTKILASRVQACLPHLINPDQNGFVRGRTLEDNITLMRATLATASTEKEDPGAVILIDFNKAYDTVDREYLWIAMEQFGFPENFIELIRRLHHDTRACFLVNGELSGEISVITGIRQGCPLAPLLFLIAAETLKYAIDSEPLIAGIQLPGKDTAHTHTFSAFVDDSAVFLQHRDMITALERVLERFGAVSGLRAQPHKSHAIVLDKRYPDSHLGSFPVLPPGTTTPYLGVEIGLTDLTERNWDKRITKIIKRLGSVSQYTTGVSDRIQVISLGCVPSLLFTARFFTTPVAAQRRIDGIWRQFVWRGSITQAPQRAHKLARKIMELPRSLGGLGLHDYRGATLCQAATAILRWNARPHDKYWSAFRLLINPSSDEVTPLEPVYPKVSGSKRKMALPTTSAPYAAGIANINRIITNHHRQPPALREAKGSLLRQWSEPWRGVRWMSTREGRISVPPELRAHLSQVQMDTYAAMPVEVKTFWPTFHWRPNEWIRDASGATLLPNYFRGIRITSLDELQLREVEPGVYEFRNPTNDPTTIRRSTLISVSRWIRIIICNLARLPDDTTPLQARIYSAGPHPVFDLYEWTQTPTGDIEGRRLASKWRGSRVAQDTPHLRAHYHGWGAPLTFTALATDATTLDDLDVLKEATVLLAAHPSLQQGPTLIPMLTTIPQRSKLLKTLTHNLVRPTVRHPLPGLMRLHDRLERQLQNSTAFNEALQQMPLKRLARKAWGTTEYQQTFWYRLVLGAHSLRDSAGQPLSCPHTFCGDRSALTMEHVLWTCPGAQQFWGRLWEHWTGLPFEQDVNEPTPLHHIFARSAPKLISPLPSLLHDCANDDVPPTESVQSAWEVICTVAAQSLWLKRNDAQFRTSKFTLVSFTESTWAAVRRHLAGLYGVKAGGRPFTVFWETLSIPRDRHDHRLRRVRLYFDGGSRGNPGVSGGGSVLLTYDESHAAWTLLWWTARYVGDHTTNNHAEHAALLTGLEECVARFAETPIQLTIIGDSKLVLSQVAGTAASQVDLLQEFTKKTTRILNTIQAVDLKHTLRAGNKMADYLANTAMDQRISIAAQTHWTSIDDHLTTLLPHDVSHPTSSIRRGYNLLHDVAAAILRHQVSTYYSPPSE